MLFGDLREAERFAQRWRCRKCPETTRLTASWNCEGKSWQVVCLNCGATEKADFYRPKSLTQQWLENPESVAVGIANNLETKYKQAIEAACDGLPPELADMVRQRYSSQSGERLEEANADQNGTEAAVLSEPSAGTGGQGGRSQGTVAVGAQTEAPESPKRAPGGERSYIVSSKEWDW